MCGRFTLTSSAEVVADLFGLTEMLALPERYNIVPTQNVQAVIPNDNPPARRLITLRWGLIPSWAKDASGGQPMINARAETVATKPSFRNAFRERRCLIPASGFYEWKNTAGGKQPHHIRRRDGLPFAFAGLWERWDGDDGAINSCTIITTTPNELMKPLHDRMPVILDREDFATWLQPSEGKPSPATLQDLLRPCPSDVIEAYPVSTRVNNPRHDDAECVRRESTSGADQLLFDE